MTWEIPAYHAAGILWWKIIIVLKLSIFQETVTTNGPPMSSAGPFWLFLHEFQIKGAHHKFLRDNQIKNRHILGVSITATKWQYIVQNICPVGLWCSQHSYVTLKQTYCTYRPVHSTWYWCKRGFAVPPFGTTAHFINNILWWFKWMRGMFRAALM